MRNGSADMASEIEKATPRAAGETEKATLRIAVAQLNPVVGDISGNLAKARAAR